MTWERVKDRYRHASALSVPLPRTGSVQQGVARLRDMKNALDGVSAKLRTLLREHDHMMAERLFYNETEEFASAVRHALAEGVDLVLTHFGSLDEDGLILCYARGGCLCPKTTGCIVQQEIYLRFAALPEAFRNNRDPAVSIPKSWL